MFNNLEFARRKYAGKQILYLTFREPQNHNPKLELLFDPNIRLVTWPRPTLRFQMCGRKVILPPRTVHDSIARFLSKIWFRIFARANFIELDERTLGVDLPIDKELLDSMQRVPGTTRPLINGHTIDAPLFIYNQRHPASPLRLPETIRASILERLDSMLGTDMPHPRGRCGFYFKCDESGDAYNNGSPIESYLPAIRFVVEDGYQVLIQGDRRLSPDQMASFKGMVVDDVSLSLDFNLYNLFVATDCTIFIGDSGPGSWIAGTSGIPQLLLNGWIMGLSFGTTWVYFKSSFYSDGTPVPLFTQFRDLPSQGPMPDGIKEVVMTTEEISEAVEKFLANPIPSQPRGQLEHLLVSKLPAWTTFRACGISRLSPAWPDKVKKMPAYQRELGLDEDRKQTP